MYYLASALVLLVQLWLADANWWLLGVESISENQEKVDCDLLNRSLVTVREAEFCRENDPVVKLIAVGGRKAILQCQTLFADSRWNCTTFHGNDLFGKFIYDGTRETGFVNAMYSASAGLEIAAACREERLKSCTCKTQGTNGFYGENYITYSCDYDPDAAKELLNTFLNDNEVLDTEATAQRRSEIHNHNVGIEHLKKMKQNCRCVGLSGACTVQKCYYKSPDVEELGAILKNGYDSAVRVQLNSNKTDLVPVNQLSTFNVLSVVHVSSSPSFCLSDAPKGIVGTEDRSCNIDTSGRRQCSVLCCDRGYYTETSLVSVEKCEFVWCCRVECVKKEVTVSNHFCNKS